MIERFLKQTKFTSEQDFKEHLEFIIPEDFNFAYDVMDEWAKIKPDHVALLWARGNPFHIQGPEGAERQGCRLLPESRYRSR